MYLECIRCPKLGSECDGPNFLAMSPQELIFWCRERKKHLGLTNAKLAEMTGMSQGTIDGLLANAHADFKFGTIRPVLQALVGGKWLGDPCADPHGTVDAELKERVRELDAEIKWRDDKLAHYAGQLKSMETLITNTNARHTNSQEFMREQIRGKNKTIAILGTFLGICLLVIITALIVDRLNPNIGFFWLDDFTSWLNTTGNFLRGNA